MLRIARGRQDLLDLTDFSQFAPARNACPLKPCYGRRASQREAGGSRDAQACPPVPGDGRRARRTGKKGKNLNLSSGEQLSSNSAFSLTVVLPNDRFLLSGKEVRYARKIYWKIGGRWTHLHFKSKEIIDRLKIDGVRVVGRVSDYLKFLMSLPSILTTNEMTQYEDIFRYQRLK